MSQRGSDFKNTKYLVGIVSFGTVRCAEGYPGVYTSIEYYLPWIKRNMRTLGDQDQPQTNVRFATQKTNNPVRDIKKNETTNSPIHGI